MNYDEAAENASNLFASLLGDVSEEQWENFKQQHNELGMYFVDEDSEGESDSDNSSSPCGDGKNITNIEIIEAEDRMQEDEAQSDEEASCSGPSWGCDAAVKYVNGEISFSELNDIILDDKSKEQIKKKPKLDQNEQKEETQIEKEHREYQEELKHKLKRRRKMNELPKELEGLMGSANMSYANGEFEEAIKKCLELIRLAHGAYEPFLTLGMIYEEMGEMRKALQYSLVAACLNPSNTDEWIRLAELCIEQNQLKQAIICFSYAIKSEPSDINLLWERCNLYEQVGDRKQALVGYDLILKQLSSPEDGEKCVELSREIAKIHHENKDLVNAIKVLETAFTKYPNLITSEDVNFLLELQMVQGYHKAAIKNFVQHCEVALKVGDRKISKYEEVIEMKEEDFVHVDCCLIPENLPIDLWVKVLICLIHLKSSAAIKPLIESLKKETPTEIGDLYLDVAEALMETGEHDWAIELLQLLLVTDGYNLPAVWMKYADCWYALSRVDDAALAYKRLNDAVMAYNRVIEMAPSYQEARLALSKIYLSMGKIEEATNILKQDYENDKEAVIGIDALYERCKLLEAEEKWDEFISSAILLQFSHCLPVEAEEEFSCVLANASSRRRYDALKELKTTNNKSIISFSGKKVPAEELWNIYRKISHKLFELHRLEEFMNISFSALTSTVFSKNISFLKEVEFQALLSCIYCKKYNYAYILVKDLVLKNHSNNAAWNLFSLVITYSQELRFNRFCMRQMMKHQDHLALGYLNGHGALMAGTYKHALGEYMCLYKEKPNDPITSFFVGIAFIHMACQKFALKPHFLMLQGFAFLVKYMKLRGENQETFYNIGRALHQLGVNNVAIYYYKKALEVPPIIQNDNKAIFDLKKEIAYNLALIYQSVGSMDLASFYMRKYIVV